MTVTYRDAAAHLCARSGWSVSNLKLQKILYMADMNFVGMRGHRLVDHEFEAWDYGPVSPPLYQDCKAFGSKPVPNVFWGSANLDGTKEAEILNLAWDMLKPKSPGELVQITHWQGGAWAKRYVPGVKCIKISTQDMIDEYNARRAAKRTSTN